MSFGATEFFFAKNQIFFFNQSLLVIVDCTCISTCITHTFFTQKVVFKIWCTAYRKFPKYSDTQKICCYHPKSWSRWRFLRVIHPKDAEEIANSVDPIHTAPLGAVWSGSALFAQTCLSKNLGKLQYIVREHKFPSFFQSCQSLFTAKTNDNKLLDLKNTQRDNSLCNQSTL